MTENYALVRTLVHELDEITVADRIRQKTDLRVQERIDNELVGRVGHYVDASARELTMRLGELEEEWDIERMLLVQSSLAALLGLALGTRRPGWLVLSAVSGGLLAQHAIFGWSPLLAAYRRRGYRTRREIDLEIHMLKLLRGDFDRLQGAGLVGKLV